jgi:hypothetical protein
MAGYWLDASRVVEFAERYDLIRDENSQLSLT